MVRAVKPFFLVGLLIMAVVVAGCAGGGAPSDDGTIVDRDPPEGGGTVEGLVTDDQVRPLGGAIVAVLDVDAQTTTDDTGKFSLQGLQPGTVQVVAQKLGYETAARSVEVAEGEVAKVTFELAAIAVSEPYTEVLGPFAGYFDCRMGTLIITGPCGAIGWPNDISTFHFEMHEDTDVLIGETRWEQGSAATSQNLRTSFSYGNRTSSHWFCSATGSSPTQWQFWMEDEDCVAQGGNTQQLPSDEPDVPDPELDLITYVNTPFGGLSTDNPPVHLALQQRFEIMIALFQNSEPEEGYTPWPDA